MLTKPLGLLTTLALLLSLTGCDAPPTQSTNEPMIRPVKILTVGPAEAIRANQFPAVVGASRLTELSFQVGGMLQELPIHEAQRLNRGDLIAKLDPRDLQSELDSARSQFENAQQEYERVRKLADKGAISRSTLEQRKTQLDVSRSQLERAQKRLEDSTLLAPFNGIVAQKRVKKLQSVNPGQVIVNYMSTETLEATVDLPANYLAHIPKSESDGARQALVTLDAAPNQVIEAEFKEASLLADTVSQTYAITFTFRPPEELLILPGMNATVELLLSRNHATPRVTAPLEAILFDGEQHAVWVVNPETMTVHKRAVTIEESVGESIIITEGLAANEMIASAGAAHLSEGMQVREWQP